MITSDTHLAAVFDRSQTVLLSLDRSSEQVMSHIKHLEEIIRLLRQEVISLRCRTIGGASEAASSQVEMDKLACEQTYTLKGKMTDELPNYDSDILCEKFNVLSSRPDGAVTDGKGAVVGAFWVNPNSRLTSDG